MLTVFLTVSARAEGAIHAGEHMADFINTIERELIDALRTAFPDFVVFGQYPETEDVKYPCIIVQQFANGLEEKFYGQRMTFGGEEKKGELYGMAFAIHVMVDIDSSMDVTPDGESSTEVYKQRRLLNYAMLNIANTLMDVTFDADKVEVTERHFAGFRDVDYVEALELWGASTTLTITFQNYRPV